MDHTARAPSSSREEFADGPPAKRQALEEGDELPCGTEPREPARKRKSATKPESIIEAGVPLHWQAVGQHSPQIFDGAIEEALSVKKPKPINGLFWNATHTKLSTAWSALINGSSAVFEMNGSFNINVRRRFEISRALAAEVLGLDELPPHVGRFVVDNPGCSFAQLRQYHGTTVNEGHEDSSAVHEDQSGSASTANAPTTVIAPPADEQPRIVTALVTEASATAASSDGNEADSDDEVVFVGMERALRRSRRTKVKQEPTADTEESHSAAGSGPSVKQEPEVDDDSGLNLQLSPTPPPPSMAVDNGIASAVDSAGANSVPNGAAEESLDAVPPSLSAPAAALATSLEGFQCFGDARPCPCLPACQSVLRSGALGDFVFVYQKDVDIRNEHDVRVKARLYHCKGCIEARARSGSDEDLPPVFVVDGHFVHYDPNMPQGNEHRCIRDKRLRQA